jgi:phospholipid/cholesterol/gamma-HCH transport system substrate-binding protein
MQKQTPSLAKVMTMVLFALSCFGLLLFLWVSFGGPTPLKPKGYRVEVGFPEATQLGLEADVRMAGVTIGKVRDKQLDPRGNRTLATLEIDRKFAPIPKDSRAILRQKTLLGETYVEITPGHRARGTVPEGGRLADGNVRKTVELDEIFNALDKDTRKAFQGWQQGLARAVNGRGADLNGAIGQLPSFMRNGGDLLQTLDQEHVAVRNLVSNTGLVFQALTQDEGQLRNLVTGAGQVFDETARRNQAIVDTFKAFPTFLDESKLTFRRVQRFARNTDPLIRDLQPATRDLAPTLEDVRAMAPDLEHVFRNLDPLITASKRGLPALRDILDGARPLLGQLQPFLQELNPILQWLEYNQSTVSDFISNGAGALADTMPTRTPQEMGHYLRQWGPAGVETAAIWPDRPKTNRGNAYLGPTAGSGPEHAKYMILPSFDCNNAGGTRLTKIPQGGEKQTDDDPSCFEQGPLPGQTTKFPHIGRADYSKP